MSTEPLTTAASLPTAGIRQLVADYVALTKPRVQLLLLLTTVTTMYVAGDPSVELVLATCLGGSLSAGGAGAVNHWFDRDIDAQMARTATRPVPAGRIAPGAALGFGLVLGALSFAWLTVAVNPLAAVLSLCGFLGYVFVYTVWLKRRTPQNIVIGGAAGAVPPLVGWAAVTGRVDPAALYLFAIVFYWTPPHFWALSLLMKDEYARVGVPMMPVVRGEAETRRQILLYTGLLGILTLLPVVFGFFGALYAVVALALGAAFVVLAVRLQRQADRRSALRTYLFSLALPGRAVLRDGARCPTVERQLDGSSSSPPQLPDRVRRRLHRRRDVRADLGRGSRLHRRMSAHEDEAPPPGEEIHLPGPEPGPVPQRGGAVAGDRRHHHVLDHQPGGGPAVPDHPGALDPRRPPRLRRATARARPPLGPRPPHSARVRPRRSAAAAGPRRRRRRRSSSAPRRASRARPRPRPPRSR